MIIQATIIFITIFFLGTKTIDNNLIFSSQIKATEYLASSQDLCDDNMECFPKIVEKLNYIVAGSFLIPKNADALVSKLKKAGYQKCYKHIFYDSEYYSVIVDTFRTGAEISELLNSLKNKKIDYFIKSE